MVPGIAELHSAKATRTGTVRAAGKHIDYDGFPRILLIAETGRQMMGGTFSQFFEPNTRDCPQASIIRA
jgi:hypothetical protein